MSQSSITLRQLQQSIKSSLTERFALPMWVSAEISELKVNYSGHCYLELIEKGESDGVATAQAKAVIWRAQYQSLSSYFVAESGQELSPGLKVLVKVLVNYHELYGLSLQITDIDPSYTLGDMERQRQLTIAQLQKDGVWELNSSLKLGYLTQRIAIISSRNAAGYQDFCNELEGSGYHFCPTLFDAFMQGAAAEESIIAALCAVAEREAEFDAVVIIRGGGSVSDLNCFNSYRLASYVAQFPLPVVAGIGHDKDISVVDMVANTSLKTPTAVAGWLVERMQQIEGWLDNAALKLHDVAVTITRTFEIELESRRSEITSKAQQLLESERTRLDGEMALLPERAMQFIALQRSRLEGLSQGVDMHSPSHLMRLGFSVARVGGVALSSAQMAKVGERVTIEFADGEVVTEVKEVKN